MTDIEYDIVIVGGSLGGVSAARSAGGRGLSVCLIEATAWLGGQFTAQGVTKPDENQYVDIATTVGSNPSYRDFRNAVRTWYQNNRRLSPAGLAQQKFNPGGPDGDFSMEPLVGHAVLLDMLSHMPTVHVRLNTVVSGVDMDGAAVVAVRTDNDANRYLAKYFLDATDLGEMLALCGEQGVDWVIGAESHHDTGEDDAPEVAHPEWIQPISMPFAIEYRPGEPSLIQKPDGYDELKKEANQNYTIIDNYIDRMFVAKRSFWAYRSVILAANFHDPEYRFDVTMVNADSNDYQGGTIPTGNAAVDAEVIAKARIASLGYLYWLQTECPRDGPVEAYGYPEFRLRKDYFNTLDGTSAQPYIRESRRIKAVTTVYQQDIEGGPKYTRPRARLFEDSCGIGDYGFMDVHPCKAAGTEYKSISVVPYQIPLGALIPARWTNLLPACKNIGTTHLTNGAYRIHPTEWAIGEAAGALAAFCIQQGITPASIHGNVPVTREFQRSLLNAGIPIYWWRDITLSDRELFSALNRLGVAGIVSGDFDMSFRPHDDLTGPEKTDIESSARISLPAGMTKRGEAAKWLAQQLPV